MTVKYDTCIYVLGSERVKHDFHIFHRLLQAARVFASIVVTRLSLSMQLDIRSCPLVQVSDHAYVVWTRAPGLLIDAFLL